MANQRVVTLNADGIAEREIMYVRYELNQQTDVEGQPTGTTRGGKIYFKVKSNDDGNTDLLEWMCDTYMSKSGTISWPNRQGLSKADFRQKWKKTRKASLRSRWAPKEGFATRSGPPPPASQRIYKRGFPTFRFPRSPKSLWDGPKCRLFDLFSFF